MKKTLLLLFLLTSLYANDFSVNTSFQGYTGVINTPNAQVTKEGHAVIHFDNQFDNVNTHYNYETKHSYQEDYIFGVGLFSFMEVQGRLSEARGYHRDLSANVKLQLPYHHKYLPDIAVGVQDLGGEANHYDNKYIVMDKELWFVRASLGYGHSSVENKTSKRMDGVFGGIEIKTTDWLYLMAEDDTKEQHVALRLEMPKSWLSAFNLRATVAQNLKSDDTSFNITMDIPLFHESKIQQDIYQNQKIKQEKDIDINDTTTTQTDNNTYKLPQTTLDTTQPKIDSLISFQSRLVDFGFENVRVGQKDKTIYVEVENTIFDQTDLDALGYIIGTLSESELDYKHYQLTLLKNNIQTISIKGDTENFKHYIEDPSIENEKKVTDGLSFYRSYDDSTISYSKLQNNSFFKPRVEFSLGLRTTVGTEHGVLDYVASLRTNAYMTLYDGLVVSAMYETPFAHSDDFGKGGAYYNKLNSNLDNKLVSAMLHQTIHVQNLLDTVSIGRYKTDYTGLINQANLTSTSGTQALEWRAGVFTNQKYPDTPKKQFSLFSYRYLYSPIDLYGKITYGKFWYGDTGGKLEIKRFFGETSVAFNYKNTSLKGQKEQSVGIKLAFPMTTRKLYKANYIQFKGKKDFSYTLNTTINRKDGTNTLNVNNGVIPHLDLELNTHYLDRDRLNGSYIKQHVDRMRDAYITYKDR